MVVVSSLSHSLVGKSAGRAGVGENTDDYDVVKAQGRMTERETGQSGREIRAGTGGARSGAGFARFIQMCAVVAVVVADARAAESTVRGRAERRPVASKIGRSVAAELLSRSRSPSYVT